MKFTGIKRIVNDPKVKMITSKHYIQRTRPEKAFLRAHEANEWLNAEGKKYFWGQERLFIQGKFESENQPFPFNSSFKVENPIGDKLKQEIFDRFITRPDVNTVVQLSSSYKLSIDRIKAIIKLKWLEKGMETKGIALQHHYQASMDKLLKSKMTAKEIEPESALRFYKAREKPIFVPSEVSNMSPDAAAKAMHTDPFQTKIEKIRRAASKPFRIPQFLSDMYCPTVLYSSKQANDLANTLSLSSAFTKDKLTSKKYEMNNFYPGTVQSDSSNPVFESNVKWTRKPRFATVFVNISSSKSTPKERWNPEQQKEHIVPSISSGNIIVRDRDGVLRTPNAKELRSREKWGKLLIKRRLYKNF